MHMVERIETTAPAGSREARLGALEWAILARQKAIAQGARSAPVDLLNSDPIWVALSNLSRDVGRGDV